MFNHGQKEIFNPISIFLGSEYHSGFNKCSFKFPILSGFVNETSFALRVYVALPVSFQTFISFLISKILYMLIKMLDLNPRSFRSYDVRISKEIIFGLRELFSANPANALEPLNAASFEFRRIRFSAPVISNYASDPVIPSKS